MTADNNFSKDNVFINFQLTKKRGEICKEVRQAKIDGIVKSYEIDANGRIFIRYASSGVKTEIFEKEYIQNNLNSSV